MEDAGIEPNVIIQKFQQRLTEASTNIIFLESRVEQLERLLEEARDEAKKNEKPTLGGTYEKSYDKVG